MNRLPRNTLRNIQRGPRLLYKLGLGPLISRLILLLTTTGRKSGLPRTTPLQYEEIDGAFYIAAALGEKADWYRNLLACPQVLVQAGRRQFTALAEPVSDPAARLAFMRTRLERHPRMVGAILKSDGVDPSDESALQRYVEGLAVVRLEKISLQSSQRKS